MAASQTPSPAPQAPSNADVNTTAPLELSPSPAPQAPVHVTVQMPDTRAAGPTEGLSETVKGGRFETNGKSHDAFGREIKD